MTSWGSAAHWPHCPALLITHMKSERGSSAHPGVPASKMQKNIWKGINHFCSLNCAGLSSMCVFSVERKTGKYNRKRTGFGVGHIESINLSILFHATNTEIEPASYSDTGIYAGESKTNT